MNNLKFRAYFQQYKRMIENIGIVNNEMILVDFSNNGNPENFESIFITEKIHVMQSTGLFDKSGKEIFEGDIVDIGNGFINTIDYKLNDGCWRLKPVDRKWSCSYFSNYQDKKEWEVIGNIYKNKDLLEG